MDPVRLRLPFDGRWLVQNSPAWRVPSHGTELFGTALAIDFVAVDGRGRSAGRDLRSLLGAEPPERFVGFGAPILAPCDGTVVAGHDGEPDHIARRSWLTLLPYALTQAGRVRRGPAAIAGNHVTIRTPTAFVTLVHLRRGSLLVHPGDAVREGQVIAACGNSGNSTEPHVHVQANDRLDLAAARALPLHFARFREWPAGGSAPRDSEGVPGDGSIVAPA